MADNELFSDAINASSFGGELELLPLISKERTQRFELLLHLIPNLKQHIILCGESGIGKTLLLDMLYDLDSDVWQCCFIQGSAELSFETIEAQLNKTMLRNKHVSLDSALQTFKEQHKKIVLIIDDAGLLVSGLMTTLIEYAAAQPAIKLIFSLTPETKQAHRNTDKALNDCYILELPPLSKLQCAYFLRHLAAKPRTYGAIPIDEKLVEKIYADTQGIPARIITDFTKLSRKSENDYSKWIAGFIGVTVLAIGINQGVRYFKKDEPIEEMPVALPVEKIETVKPVEKTPVATIEKEALPSTAETEKPELDIVIPEFKLDIEKGIPPATQTQATETATPTEKTTEAATPTTETVPAIEAEKTPTTNVPETEKAAETVAPPVPEAAKIEPAVKIEPVIEKIPEPIKPKIDEPKIVAPQIIEPIKPATPEITFPKIQPAKGVKIQPLSDKPAIHVEPIPAPMVKEVKPQVATKIVETKATEEVKKMVDEKKIEPEKAPLKAEVKPVEEKKVVPEKVEPQKTLEKPKVDAVKKVELEVKAEKEKSEKTEKTDNKKLPQAETKKDNLKAEPATANHFTLQLITLSSETAVDNFKKKHAALSNNVRIVKSGTEEQPRFAIMYGGFANTDDAAKAREKLPAEFAGALPRKLNH